MSSTNSVSSANPLADLVSRLTRKYDANGDSQLSTQEFGAFLNDFLNNGVGARTNSTFAAGTAANTSPASGPAVGTMEGFDPGKLANPSHQSLKYRIGRILQQYPNSPQGLRDALPAIQTIVPDARIAGTNGDKLDFGSYVDNENRRIGVVDVLRGSALGGLAWQWQPVE